MARLEHDGLLDRTARGYAVRQQSPPRSVLDLARLSPLLARAESCKDRVEFIDLNAGFQVALRETAHNHAVIESRHPDEQAWAVLATPAGAGALVPLSGVGGVRSPS